MTKFKHRNGSPSLTKSKLLSWLQCPRRLFLEINPPDDFDVPEVNKTVLEAGNVVGVKACEFYPDGVMIDWLKHPGGRAEAILQTAYELSNKSPKPIFEATFAHDRILVRADLLVPENQRWHLMEVKSSTEVKDYHLYDAAIQRHVLSSSGVKLGNVSLVTINKNFVYPGGGCYREVLPNGDINSLFQGQDVSQVTATLAKKDVPGWIAGAWKTLAGKLPGTTDRCKEPYPCPYSTFCYPESTEYPLGCLPRIGKKAADLKAKGYRDIRDIPEGVLTNATQEWVRRVTVAGKPEVRPGAASILSKHAYPRYYLDFETIQFAVPIWQGTKPYQQIPFQWSCHVENKDGGLKHFDFLDTSGEDPTRAFAEALIKVVGKRGPIYVYNQGFEEGRIKELAAKYKDIALALEAIAARLFDLLPLTRDHYYHPAMKGSWSIKYVLPTRRASR